MKPTPALLLALLAPPAALFAAAAVNPYDLVGRALMPFVQVLAEKSKSPNRALLLDARLEAMTDLPRELAGARAEIALQAPDRLRLRGPVLGEMLTICRNGDQLWVHPGAKAEALLNAATHNKRLPKPNAKAELEPFRLPVPEQQLVFLPALFQVRDAGAVQVDGAPCRSLDLQLMPELARSLKAAGWTARLTVSTPEARPVHLGLRRAGPKPADDWQLSVRFTRVEFHPTLPPATWEPTPEQAADLLRLTPARYDQLLRALGGGK